MTKEKILQKIYQLNTHPINPKIDRKGQPIESDVLVNTLEPNKDQRHVSYFFDLYEWHTGNVLQGIDDNTGFKFFQKQTGDKPLLIIIDGYDSTGRMSLSNLLLMEIANSHIEKPICISRILTGFDKNLYARDLANAFVDDYLFEEDLPKEDRLRALIKEAQEQEQSNPGTGFLSIFQRFHTFVRRECKKRPIVFLVNGVDHLDGWRYLNDILSPLANYIIAITTRDDEARVARDILPRQPYNFASVSASNLTADEAIDFLRDRLSKERLPGLPVAKRMSLEPFTKEAVQALFTPGSKQPNAIVNWPIEFVIKRICFALDQHLIEFESELMKVNENWTLVPETKKLITSASIRRYTEFEKDNLLVRQ